MDYKQILEICEKATPGPWKLQITDRDYLKKEYAAQRINDEKDVEILKVYSPQRDTLARDNNADLIVLARTSLPELIERCMALEKVVDTAKNMFVSCHVETCRAKTRQVNHDYCFYHQRLYDALAALKDGE